MTVERRQLIQILGAGLLAGGPGLAAEYTPRALTASEYALVDRVADIIIPTDELSPGAHEAGVARYVDIVLLYGDRQTLASWKSGAEAVASLARSGSGKSFAELDREAQTVIVRRLAVNEANPTTAAEVFFATAKRLIIEAFYLSQAGKDSLGYKGDTAIMSFRGCTDHSFAVEGTPGGQTKAPAE